MKRSATLSSLLASAAYAASPETLADTAPLSAAELYSSCAAHGDDPESAAGRACAGYVRGFLDGARVIATAPSSSHESFRERALRTRAGSRYSTLVRDCLATSMSFEQLVSDLLTRRVADPAGTPAATAVRRSLQRLGGCRPH
jgi:hypothetical protein